MLIKRVGGRANRSRFLFDGSDKTFTQQVIARVSRPFFMPVRGSKTRRGPVSGSTTWRVGNVLKIHRIYRNIIVIYLPRVPRIPVGVHKSNGAPPWATTSTCSRGGDDGDVFAESPAAVRSTEERSCAASSETLSKRLWTININLRADAMISTCRMNGASERASDDDDDDGSRLKD